jgi:hypothetical protein
MPCLFALLALVTPRLAIALLWFFTGFFAGVFDTALWLILGFLFLPTTLLWYVAVQHWFGGEFSSAVPIIGIVIALMIDVSPAGGRRKKKE